MLPVRWSTDPWEGSIALFSVQAVPSQSCGTNVLDIWASLFLAACYALYYADYTKFVINAPIVLEMHWNPQKEYSKRVSQQQDALT
jgi:hypothetical protein